MCTWPPIRRLGLARKTGRLVGVNRATVARYGRKAGAHAADLHDELVAVSPSDPPGATR